MRLPWQAESTGDGLMGGCWVEECLLISPGECSGLEFQLCHLLTV